MSPMALCSMTALTKLGGAPLWGDLVCYSLWQSGLRGWRELVVQHTSQDKWGEKWLPNVKAICYGARLDWVCTVVLVGLSYSNKHRKIAQLQIQQKSCCSFYLSPMDATCWTEHWNTASPTVLQLPWQRSWWAQIKREGRTKEQTNLFPLPDLGATYPDALALLVILPPVRSSS